MLTLHLPHEASRLLHAAHNEVLLVTNADLRESANVQCWPVQEKFEAKLQQVLAQQFGITLRRAHPVKADRGHGFISSQREGSDLFAAIDPRRAGHRAADGVAIFAPSRRRAWCSIAARSCCWRTSTAPGRALSACCAWPAR